MKKYALITDFDGTITTTDIGNALCMHYGLTTLEKIEYAYNNKASAREWMQMHFGQVKTTKEEFEKLVLTFAEIRPGFKELCIFALENNIPFEIASGGLDIYIKPVIDAYDCQIEVLSVTGEITPNGIQTTFEDYKGLEMDEFKQARVRYYQEQGYTVLYFGDGPGDFKAASIADIVFATDRLEKLLIKHGIKYNPFDNYNKALAFLRGKDVSLSVA